MTTFSILAEAKLYVGTYAKYNNGSIEGEWLNLADYDSKEDFLNACAELHKDETDPELMFQDFEGFPENLYSECSIFDFWALAETLENSGIENFELYAEWCSHFGYDIENSAETFIEAYCGESTESDYAYELAQEFIGDDNSILARYFDYDKWERDLFMTDYTSINGHIFRVL